jgi:hypothetical protein
MAMAQITHRKVVKLFGYRKISRKIAVVLVSRLHPHTIDNHVVPVGRKLLIVIANPGLPVSLPEDRIAKTANLVLRPRKEEQPVFAPVQKPVDKSFRDMRSGAHDGDVHW